MTRNGKVLDRAAGRRLGNVDCGLLEASLYLQVLHGFTGVVRRGVTGRVLALQKEYFLAAYPTLAVKLVKEAEFRRNQDLEPPSQYEHL
jgi:hypothetical protein